MRRKNRKIALCLISALAVSLGVIGVSSLNGLNRDVASASNAQANVDALGNFVWDEVAGATGYSITYTIGSETSETFTAEENQANVGVAIMKAANAAKVTSASSASITFNITPTGVDSATATVYEYGFERYVDQAYASHDIADVKAALATPTKLTDIAGLDGEKYDYWIPSAMYKNDLLTMGFRADETIAGNEGFFVGMFVSKQTGDKGALDANYRINQRATGEVTLSLKGTSVTNYDTQVAYKFSAETDYNTALTYGKPYYLSMGVFDTYDLNGNIIGETVYYTRSEYDANTDELVEVGGFEQFVDNNTITEKGLTYTEDTKLTSSVNTMRTDRDAILINVRGYVDAGKTIKRQKHVYVFSGKPEYSGIEAPSGLYYDNADATFNWNSVKGANSYEWRAGNGAWQRTSVQKVSVESLLTGYQSVGYLPLSVRAVGGKTSTYNLDLKRFYKTRSRVIDFTALAKASSNLSTYVKDGLEDSWYGGGKAFYDTGFSYGDHMTFAFEIQAETAQITIGSIGFFGADKKFDNLNRYWLVLVGDGTVQLGNHISIYNKNERSKDKYWRIPQVVNGFQTGTRYFITYGIDEVYEGDDKVADRVSVRVEQEESYGLNRRTVALVTFDNEMFATDGYQVAEGDTLQVGLTLDYCLGYVAKKDTDTQVEFTVDGETVATKTVDFGSTYDFSDVAAQTIDIPTGYEMNGWEYERNGKKRDFAFTGIWNVIAEDAFEVQAKLTPIEYTVSYGVACNNPTKYTTESTWALEAPASIPQGKVFAGWYDSTDSNKTIISSLAGKTGDITLLADFKDGYTITITAGDNISTIDYKAGDDPITLSAPTIENKDFIGWQIFDGENYVDYDGNTTNFIPTGAHKFKAVYEWTKYTITYQTSGGAHTNAQTYTVNEKLTFADATKEGYFFLGWYEEESCLTKVTDTQGRAGNLTLYAKFVEHALPENVEMDRSSMMQELPAPKMPDGASYVVAMSLNGEAVEITDNEYTFDKAGDYELVYTITLASGEVCSYTVAYTVADVYTVNVHYGEGESVTLKKAGGESIAETEIPAMPAGYTFGGLYLDSEYTQAYDGTSVISEDTDIYVKWIPEVTEEPAKVNTTALIVGIIVLMVCLGGCATLIVWQTKKKDE